MPIETWFPTIVFFEDLALDASVRHPALDAVLECARRVAPDGEPFGLTADGAPNDLHLDPRLAPLIERIGASLARFFFDELHLDRDRVEFHIGRCWPVAQRGQIHSGIVHTHRGAAFSGVFFLAAPEGSGGLELHRPGQSLWDGLPKRELSRMTYSSVTYEAVEDRLIVFSSDLQHNRLPNTAASDDVRAAIAFDVFSFSDIDAFGSGMPRREHLKPIA